ncbi:MAG: hypothetical protein M0C28_01910 [Candidatus Moduliflexus flocculans]|nr:hypothetical protein [Candidatus Moduliflexus flocculans]
MAPAGRRNHEKSCRSCHRSHPAGHAGGRRPARAKSRGPFREQRDHGRSQQDDRGPGRTQGTRGDQGHDGHGDRRGARDRFDLPFVLYQKEPNRMRMDITVAEAATTITQAFDGRRGWGTDARTMRPEEMPEIESRDVSHKALGNAALLDPRSLGVTYALKPKQNLGDRDYIVLEQTLSDGHKTAYFLDPETHLPARLATRTLDPAGADAEAETVFSDYREFCGARIACSSRTLRGGKEVQRLTVTGVACNAGLDDSLFELKNR